MLITGITYLDLRPRLSSLLIINSPAYIQSEGQHAYNRGKARGVGGALERGCPNIRWEFQDELDLVSGNEGA